MHVLGLITAREGSKGVPRKNTAPLLGRPLLAYTCDAATASRTLTRVVLSTDGGEIADLARQAGIDVPFMRPPHLALDDTPSIDVALHAIDWLEANESWHTDLLVLLQPTSPMRTHRHIDEAVELLRADPSVDTVVSVTQVPHRFNPFSVMEIRGGRLVPHVPDPLPFDRYRRQNLPICYARNGPAVLVTKREVLAGRHTFYGPHTRPYPMSKLDSLDIDDEFDLVCAEAALEYRARGRQARP